MNKDFEKAYKELAETEAPDLWDRIEAGISEKSTPETGKKPIPVKSSLLLFVKRYSAVAAAVVCALILIPTTILMKKAGNKSFSEGVADAAPPVTMDAAEEAETTEETADVKTESASEEMMTESALLEAPEEAAGAVSEEASNMEIKETAEEKRELSGEAEVETKEAMKDTADAVNEEKNQQNSLNLANVTVTVEAVKEQAGEDTDEPGTFYTVIVKEDPSGFLMPEQEITIFIPSYSSFVLMEGDTYELTIQPLKEDLYSVTAFGRQPDE